MGVQLTNHRMKPTLGYPSRTAAIQGLLSQGLTRREIADRIGIDTKVVNALLSGAARDGRQLLKTASRDIPPRSVVHIDDSTIDALRPHAKRRGISHSALIRLLVDTIVADGLLSAILDDEGK